MRLLKLVRDRIGEDGNGRRYDSLAFEPLGETEHVEALRRKLVEEAAEYLLKPGVEELADVYEVIAALAAFDLGVGLVEVGRIMEEKREAVGGFREGIGMFATYRE